jgi:hypothetical protein
MGMEGALVRPSPPLRIRSTWSGFHSDLPSAARTTDLDDSGSCPRRSRMAGRVQELCDGVVLRGVGHAGGGEQAGLAAQERAGIWRALVVGVEPVRRRRPTRARRRYAMTDARRSASSGSRSPFHGSMSHGALVTGWLAMLPCSLYFSSQRGERVRAHGKLREQRETVVHVVC